jgi:hypothetical protein
MLAAGCAAQGSAYLDSPAQIEATGTWVHAPSGMSFPSDVAGFRRGDIAHFSARMPDVAVAYNLLTPTGTVAATIYLLPAPQLATVGLSQDAVADAQARACRATFAVRLHEITQQSGADARRQRSIEIRKGNRPWTGRVAEFEYETTFAGRRQSVDSDS